MSHSNSRTLATALALATMAATSSLAQASEPAAAGSADPAPLDLAALIECRGDLALFQALAPVLDDPLLAVAMGWRPLPRANLFMTEFILPSSVTVLGHSSDHIAFAGDTLVAVLDLADPRPLARELGLEAAIDTPAKVMFGKEVRSLERLDPATGEALVESQVLAVSNVDSHPGKALVGCSYSIDLAEDPGTVPDIAPDGGPAPTVDTLPH